VARLWLQNRIVSFLQQSNRAPMLVLHGIGGAGKTTLARWLYRAPWLEYLFSRAPQKIWVRCAADDSVTAILKKIAAELGLPMQADFAHGYQVQLRDHLIGDPYLIIIDNFQDVGHTLCRLNVGHLRDGLVLVTTRSELIRSHQREIDLEAIEVGAMTRGEAERLLFRQISGRCQFRQQELPVLGALLERLAGLPLALDLVAKQLAAGVPVLELLSIFQSEPPGLDLLDWDRGSPTGSLIRCFDDSFWPLNAAQQSGFVQLGCFEGPFSRSAIETLWGTDDNTTGWILEVLQRRGLVAGGAEDVFYLHPLLRDYARYKLNLFRTRHNGPFLGVRRTWASGTPEVGL